jgi:septal ring factor EnvC (AmiA/AmiB activator)
MILFQSAPLSGDERIKEFQDEIKSLSEELEIIKKNERGVLDELWGLEAEKRLLEVEIKATNSRLGQISEDIQQSREKIADVHENILLTSDDLSQSIRNLYKLGRLRHYRLIFIAENQTETIQFFKYAEYFAKKDFKLIGKFKKQLEDISAIENQLAQEESDLSAAGQKLTDKKKQLIKSERRSRSLLRSIQEEKEIHHQAREELINACQELEKLIESFGELKKEQLFPVLNASKFRRFFSWPAKGEISTRFGVQKHPRFKTAIPHNGIDIEAEFGSDIRASFDGKIVFSEWFKGYGLTVIIDHGHDIYSIYAHASAIFVEAGEWVKKGTLMGKVGDSGSLKGPYLYFEIREKGKPTDPLKWLSRR